MNMRQFFSIAAVAAACLSSCQWAMMESRLADRVSGASDEYKIVGSENLLGGIAEYTAANGKKFYVHRCRIHTERKPGALFVFGEIDKKHFAWGDKAPSTKQAPTERYVLLGYDDMVFSGITPPPVELRHPMGETTTLWREWSEQVNTAKEPGLNFVSSTILPIEAGNDNDYSVSAVFDDVRTYPTATRRYVLAPLAAVADVPLTILGTTLYMPYYNVKTWLGL